MRAGRTPLGSTLLIAMVGAGTTWAALTAWSDFVTQPSDYLVPLLLVGFVVAATGALLRALGTPRLLTVLVQIAATSALVSLSVTGSPLPVGSTGAELLDALRTSINSAQAYAAPIGSQAPPIWPLLLAGGAVFILIVDVVACTLGRVPGAGLALLAVYSVPSGLLEGAPGGASFLAAATGFLVLLHLDARDELMRWGRPLGPDDRSPWGGGSPVRDAVRAGAGRIGVTATALALVLPAFIPVLDVDVFDLGAGAGDGDIRIRKPVTDMRRDLERGRDRPMVRIRTDDPDPEYLRISVLNRFTGTEWSSGDRDVASDNVPDGRLPDPTGLSQDVPRTEYSYDVDITEQFVSTWLPTQFPASLVEAEGDWRFDPGTMDFLAADDDLTTRGIGYEMTGLALDYGTDGEFFRNAPSGSVQDEVLDLPSGVPAIARDLARSVTAPGLNDYERALLLQHWFRRGGGFEYSLERAPEGYGNDTLESFLSEEGRVGYCEQYASAMAVMARVLGIPARVAVGFLEPRRIGDGIWEYSSHDLHAWPELYFSGAGWVRFEPTPAGRVQSVPDYSRVPVDGIGEGGPQDPSGSETTDAGGTTTPAPTRAPTVPIEEGQSAEDGADGDRGMRTVLVAGGATVLLLVVLATLLLGPRAMRARLRRTRLAGGPDDLWTELRATAVDLGVPWPTGRSPREVGTALVNHLGDPVASQDERPRTGPDAAPAAAEALERLVVQVERARYARPGSIATLERLDLPADARAVMEALVAGVPPRRRQRAEWVPVSLWNR
ncbi:MULTISPECIES: transglutaminaseTgpA domain-containing protein [Nocardioides]|uniref:TransglutaminaseTgpA domain-containing protein n=1 Tax=Nocardioides vastitatis TaxID=2568655 RepID=A0ABW0ZD26_9ACTN|nr:DUF3488 and transglutaminase-like domain-containing protein [Nocardioides sp.]